LGKRETLARLAAVEQCVDRVDGIFNHSRTPRSRNGLPQMLGLWKAPLYVTEPTMDALQRTLPETLGKRCAAWKKSKPGSDFASAILKCMLCDSA